MTNKYTTTGAKSAYLMLVRRGVIKPANTQSCWSGSKQLNTKYQLQNTKQMRSGRKKNERQEIRQHDGVPTSILTFFQNRGNRYFFTNKNVHINFNSPCLCIDVRGRCLCAWLIAACVGVLRGQGGKGAKVFVLVC